MNAQNMHIYEFGSYRLDPAQHILLHDGEIVPLTPKVFETLLVLVQNNGQVVDKDEFLHKVWSDAIVEEASLAKNVSLLRKVLSENNSGGSFIETVPKRGYRFIAPVRQIETESLEKDQKPQKPNLLSPGKKKIGAAALTVLLVSLIGFGIWFYRNNSNYPANAKQIESIAVLPFENASGDADLDYLSDGLSESLIDRLSALPQLKVIARNSSFKYRGQNIDLQDAAHKLGVEAIVTGKVARRGDDLSIRVEMVDARENKHLWGEQYNRQAADLQTVQAEVARSVSEKLRLRLTGGQEQQLTKRATENAQAYQLYLTGAFHARRGTMEDYKKALDYYNQAVALDPNFALAFASMPAMYSNLASTSGLNPTDALAKGKAAAQRALELDETLAQAHNGLAHIKRMEWDWSGAESEYKRAIELNPNFASAHSAYALYLAGMGRTDEALAENKQARELDPFRIVFQANEGGILFSARRYDEAVQVYQNVAKMQPDYPFAHIGLGHTYAAKGMYAEAISAYQTAVRLNGETTDSQIDIGYAYAMSGKRAEALAILKKLETSKKYVSPGGLTTLYAALGDKEAAFRSLERAYSERDIRLVSLKTDFHYDSLRSDPRFQDLIRRVGLPQ